MNKINLNGLRDCAYRTAREHGFHDKEFSNIHYLMLVITELSEAVEADRKSRTANVEQFNIDKLLEPESIEEDLPFIRSFEKNIKDTIGDELADSVIRLLDLAGLRNINLSTLGENLTIDKYEEVLGEISCIVFPEFILGIVSIIADKLAQTLQEIIIPAIAGCFTIAYFLKIDILWHIEQKMKYNELRPKMHEKKY